MYKIFVILLLSVIASCHLFRESKNILDNINDYNTNINTNINTNTNYVSIITNINTNNINSNLVITTNVIFDYHPFIYENYKNNKEYVILIYFASDNDLQDYVSNKLEELPLEDIESNSIAQIYFYIDNSFMKGRNYPAWISNGGLFTQTKKVSSYTNKNTTTNKVLVKLPLWNFFDRVYMPTNDNSGDYRTLNEVINAIHKIHSNDDNKSIITRFDVIIWSHGNGNFLMGKNDNYNRYAVIKRDMKRTVGIDVEYEKAMNDQEIIFALTNILYRNEFITLKYRLAFDACFMGSLETIYNYKELFENSVNRIYLESIVVSPYAVNQNGINYRYIYDIFKREVYNNNRPNHFIAYLLNGDNFILYDRAINEYINKYIFLKNYLDNNWYRDDIITNYLILVNKYLVSVLYDESGRYIKDEAPKFAHRNNILHIDKFIYEHYKTNYNSQFYYYKTIIQQYADMGLFLNFYENFYNSNDLKMILSDTNNKIYRDYANLYDFITNRKYGLTEINEYRFVKDRYRFVIVSKTTDGSKHMKVANFDSYYLLNDCGDGSFEKALFLHSGTIGLRGTNFGVLLPNGNKDVYKIKVLNSGNLNLSIKYKIYRNPTYYGRDMLDYIELYKKEQGQYQLIARYIKDDAVLSSNDYSITDYIEDNNLFIDKSYTEYDGIKTIRLTNYVNSGEYYIVIKSIDNYGLTYDNKNSSSFRIDEIKYFIIKEDNSIIYE